MNNNNDQSIYDFSIYPSRWPFLVSVLFFGGCFFAFIWLCELQSKDWLPMSGLGAMVFLSEITGLFCGMRLRGLRLYISLLMVTLKNTSTSI